MDDELAHMLRRRAQRHPNHPDPVGMTREHLRSAEARRQKRTLSALAVTAVLATGGVVWGAQAFAGRGTGNGNQTGVEAGSRSSTSATPSGVAPTTAPPVTARTTAPPTAGGKSQGPGPAPSSGPSTPPTGDGVVHGCDPTVVPTMTAKNFAWPTRGALAGDAAFGSTLLQRATALTGGSSPKLAYAGENATTRIAVVFIDPENTDVCGPGLRAVVFHGPKGTSADQLSAQIGAGNYNSMMGFEWTQRTPDGAFTLLLIEEPTVRTLQADGVLGTDNYGVHTALSTPDGSLLTTYSPAAPVPAMFGFKDPATGQPGANPVTVTVADPTAQAIAAALGVDPAKVSLIDKSAHMGIAFKVANGPRFSLTATDIAAGAENVYWTEYH